MADSDFEVITAPELTMYLGPLVQVDADRLGFLVDLTNGVIMERWTTPVTDPALIPTWVKAIALEVAARPARNPQGLASWTKSVDDASKTERLPEMAAQAGVFLTSAEAARLGGVKRRRRRMGTIRVRMGY